MSKLDIPDADFRYYPQFIGSDSSNLFNTLITEVPWKQETVYLYGKHSLAPRQTALYGKHNYLYGGVQHMPLPENKTVNDLISKVNVFTGCDFNSVLLNLYQSANDYIGFHKDNEPQLGNNPTVASISLGFERIFHIKHAYSGKLYKILLENGSLLVMGNNSQIKYLHSLPKTKATVGTRINLTFRSIR